MQKILEMQQELTNVHNEAKGAFRRLDEQRDLVDSVHKMALSMQDVMAAQKHQGAEQARLRTEVDALRMKPGLRWDSLVGQVIGLLVAAMIGAMVAKLF